MKYKARITSLMIFAALVCCTIFLSSNKMQEAQDNCNTERRFPDIFPPEIPTSIIFAGDTIDLTLQDRRERMDKEMLSFTYSHINTMLIIKRANRLFPVVEPILKECGVPVETVKCPVLYIAPMGERAHAEALRIVEELRRAGIYAECDISGRSLKAQMKYADKLGAKYTLILGDTELEAGKAQLKNMAESSQTEIELSNIVDMFK